jgi:oligoendopeptidase F
MSPEIIEQFQKIVSTMQRMIAASGEIAEKVDAMELRTNDTLAALTSIQSDLQGLLKTYENHARMQNSVNTELADAITKLDARLSALEGAKQLM